MKRCRKCVLEIKKFRDVSKRTNNMIAWSKKLIEVIEDDDEDILLPSYYEIVYENGEAIDIIFSKSNNNICADNDNMGEDVAINVDETQHNSDPIIHLPRKKKRKRKSLYSSRKKKVNIFDSDINFVSVSNNIDVAISETCIPYNSNVSIVYIYNFFIY